MASPDSYRIPVDFRITRNPVPTKPTDRGVDQNFADIYDFAFAVITTFVKYCGIGTVDSSVWTSLAADPTLSLYSGNVNKIYVVCSVVFNAGTYMSLINVGGQLQAAHANGNSGVGAVAQADGFSTAVYAIGQIGEFIVQSGINNFFPGSVVVGQRYWLGTNGNRVTAPLTAAGNLEQYIGIAVSTKAILTNLGPAIQH